LIVEIRNDVIAPLSHFAGCFGKPWLITIDQRQTPRPCDMEKQAAEEQENEIADTDIRRMLAIYRSCRIQHTDSKIAARERQTGNFVVTKKRWFRLLLFLVLGALVLVCAFHFDARVQSWIAHHQNRTAKIFMRNVSRFGDWPEHAALGLILLCLAYWRGNKKWTRIFATMLIACALAGVSARVIKITSGRARPSVRSESVWNGPRISSKYQAFPSGHTAASAAFFGTLFFVSRRLGLACLPIPLLIAASRMYVGAHYFSDVVFAAIFGIMCAFLAAQWLLGPRSKRGT
jgi:membrane-associated phospholipid phosphatase